MSFPRYPAYKDSGVEWLGEVPAHWEVKRLRYVARLNPSKSEVAHLPRETQVSFVPMEAVGDDGSLDAERTRPIADVETGYTYFRDGDITVAKITPCFENGKGAVMRGLVGGIGFGTTELIVARPIESETTGAWLHTLFTSRPFRLLGEATMYGAGGQKRVPDEFVRNFATAFPPLAEQAAITEFLDREIAKIDALIAEQERLIELLKEKRQAVISRAVTKGLDPNVPMKDSGVEWLGEVPAHWSVATCGRYASALSGYAFPSSGFTMDESATRLLRGINVGVGEVKWEETVYWERTEEDGLDRFALSVGAIVLGMDRPLISGGIRVARLRSEDVPCLLLQRVALIRPDARLNPEFLYKVLRCQAFADYFTPDLTGVSVPHISPDQILAFQIPVPPLDEQRAIARFLQDEEDSLARMTQSCGEAAALLKDRRAALISAAVTGQIDVRDAAPAR